MNNELLKKKIINKIINNIKLTRTCFIASPSKSNPDYYYHWTRDSALVMRVILREYKKTYNSKYLEIICRYIDCEYELQSLNTIGGIGEPKFNIDRKCFNESWGRPQNDGPALRGIIMLKIIKLLNKSYNTIIKQIIEPIIRKDLEYTCDNIHNHCFDLWEENQGYHFYTRVVQCKFLKEAFLYFKDRKIEKYYKECKELLNHHYDDYSVISSFDIDGKELRRHDSSIFMSLCHIDFDNDIVDMDKYLLVNNNINDLLKYFNNKYESHYNFIGRYICDKYYDGHSWIICTLGMIQFNNFLNQNNLFNDAILDNIININKDLNLSEQYDPKNKIQYSANNLTWNYSELYFTVIVPE